jgi:hypothetical protein
LSEAANLHEASFTGGRPLDVTSRRPGKARAADVLWSSEDLPAATFVFMAARKYGILNFLLDVVLVCITGGLWLIWIFVREMRNRR